MRIVQGGDVRAGHATHLNVVPLPTSEGLLSRFPALRNSLLLRAVLALYFHPSLPQPTNRQGIAQKRRISPHQDQLATTDHARRSEAGFREFPISITMLTYTRAGLSTSGSHHVQITPSTFPRSHGVWIPPLVDDLIVGEIKSRAKALDVSSTPIPGYWISKTSDLEDGVPPKPGKKVLYYIHGGGYTSLTAHPDDPTASLPKGFLKHCPNITQAFSVEYRLLRPGPKVVHPFPTALLDALAGYVYLGKVGFKEEDIILCGDSAGGNLALALTRYLVDNKRNDRFPRPPGALVLFSPWADMSESFQINPTEFAAQATACDWISPTNSDDTVCTIRAFIGNEPDEIATAERSPYLSPASPYLLANSATQKISFKEFPRTWLDFGGSEVLRTQIKRLAVAMEEDLGKEKFISNECPGGVHGYITLDWFEPEKSENMKKVAKWLKGLR